MINEIKGIRKDNKAKEPHLRLIETKKNLPKQCARSQPTNWWKGSWRQRCGSRYASERGLKSGTDACLIRALHSPRPGGLAFKAGWNVCAHIARWNTLHWQMAGFSQMFYYTHLFHKGGPTMRFLSWMFPLGNYWFGCRDQTIHWTEGWV